MAEKMNSSDWKILKFLEIYLLLHLYVSNNNIM